MNSDTFKGTLLALSAQCAMIFLAVRWSIWTRYSPQRVRSRSTAGADNAEAVVMPDGGALNDPAETAVAQTPSSPPPLVLHLSNTSGLPYGADISVDLNNNTPSPTGGKTARAAFMGSPHASPTLKSSCQIDMHLMALIQRIQQRPLSHIFWKELRAYLLSQREEERRHGLVLQSELPIVCFSEDADLVATQIEVRSLIAREQLRRPRSSARSTPSHVGGAGGGVVTSVGGGGGDGVSPNGQQTPNSAIPSFNNTPRTGGTSSVFRQSYADVPLLEGSTSSVDGVHQPASALDNDDDGDVNEDVEALYEQFSRKLKQRLRVARSASHISEVLEDLRVRGGSDTDEEDEGGVPGAPSSQPTRGPSVEECCMWDGGLEDDVSPTSYHSPLKTSRNLFRAPIATDTDNGGAQQEALLQRNADAAKAAANEESIVAAPAATGSPLPAAACSVEDVRGRPTDAQAVPARQALCCQSDTGAAEQDNGLQQDATTGQPHGHDMATFFLKQLLDLKHRDAFLRVAVDQHHRPFLRELQHFEDQLRKMAERENPPLGMRGRRANTMPTQGQPALAQQRGRGPAADAVVPMLPVWKTGKAVPPVRPVISTTSGAMPRMSPPKPATTVADGASPPTHLKGNSMASLLKQRKLSLDATTASGARGGGGGRFVRSNTFHSIPQPQPAVPSINGGRVGQFIRTHSDTGATGANARTKTATQPQPRQLQPAAVPQPGALPEEGAPAWTAPDAARPDQNQ